MTLRLSYPLVVMGVSERLHERNTMRKTKEASEAMLAIGLVGPWTGWTEGGRLGVRATSVT